MRILCGRITELTREQPLLAAVTALFAVVAAIGTVTAPDRTQPGASLPQWGFAASILAVAAFNTEIGRHVEGRLHIGQRPNKSLSTWAFCAALTVSPAWLLLVVPAAYSYTCWRGFRIEWWKLVGSASLVTLSAISSGYVFGQLGGTLRFSADPSDLMPVVAAIAAYLFVQSLCLAVFSCVNSGAGSTLASYPGTGTEFLLDRGVPARCGSPFDHVSRVGCPIPDSHAAHLCHRPTLGHRVVSAGRSHDR